MNKNQYVNSIFSKRLLATDRTKKRIRADLMTEIEALEDQGFSLEEIVRQKRRARAGSQRILTTAVPIRRHNGSIIYSED